MTQPLEAWEVHKPTVWEKYYGVEEEVSTA